MSYRKNCYHSDLEKVINATPFTCGSMIDLVYEECLPLLTRVSSCKGNCSDLYLDYLRPRINKKLGKELIPEEELILLEELREKFIKEGFEADIIWTYPAPQKMDPWGLKVSW